MKCYAEKCEDYCFNEPNHCKMTEDLFTCEWRSVFPKSATFLEAVEWMEKGNFATNPYGQKVNFESGYLKIDGMFFSFQIKTIKGEWELLAPEKSEEPKESNTIMCPNCFIVSIEEAFTNYCCQCGYNFEPKSDTEQIREKALDLIGEIKSFLDKMPF